MTLILNPAPELYAAGQPSPEELAELSRRGVRTVINLRAASEPEPFEEDEAAEALGLRHVRLPVSGPQDLNAQTVAQFSRQMDEARARGAVLVHCASANRVGAMLALEHAWARGAAAQRALDLGRRAGLTTLEPTVAVLLGLDVPAAGGAP
ncbi:MAG: fused DSP-PTPase phosphatase/NAD kinase-like protein [Pseudomonadota bacterium]